MPAGNGRSPGARPPIRSLFLVEYGLGHKTHIHFLERHLASDPRFAATVVRVSRPGGLANLLAKLQIPPIHRRGLDFWVWWLMQYKRQQVRQCLRRHDPNELDFVYVHTQTAGAALLDLPRTVPAVVSIDLTWKLAFRESRYSPSRCFEPVHALERRVFERSDLIVSFSEWAAASVVEEYRIPASKVQVVRNGVTLPTACLPGKNGHRSNGAGHGANGHLGRNGRSHGAGANGHGPSNGRSAGNGSVPSENGLLRLGFVGNEFTRKGGDLLLRVHQERYADRAHLTLVSGGLPRQNGHAWHNVSTHKAVPWDRLMTEVVPGFDLFVFPTRFDYSPYAVIEAMTAGVPVVATKVGAIPEMIEDGVSGFLLEAPHEGPLIERVDWALAHRAKLPAMGDRARQHATTSYAAERNYPELLDLLAEVARR